MKTLCESFAHLENIIIFVIDEDRNFCRNITFFKKSWFHMMKMTKPRMKLKKLMKHAIKSYKSSYIDKIKFLTSILRRFLWNLGAHLVSRLTCNIWVIVDVISNSSVSRISSHSRLEITNIAINPLTTNVPHHIENSQLICIANELTRFYMMGNIGC